MCWGLIFETLPKIHAKSLPHAKSGAHKKIITLIKLQVCLCANFPLEITINLKMSALHTSQKEQSVQKAQEY